MRFVPFAHAALALALAPALAAENPTTVSSVEVVPWTTGPGTGSFTDGAVGDFDDDGMADALILRGDTLAFAHAVDVFTNLMQVDTGVNAMTPFGDAAAPAGFAAVRPAGLYVYALDVTGGSIAFVRTMLEGGAWAGAVDLQVGDWNDDGYQDLIGLSSSGTTILVKQGTNGGWGTTETLTLPVTIQAFAALQWDTADDELEVVVVNQANQMVLVYDHDGYGPLYTRGNALGRTLIAPLSTESDLGHDRVALYMGNATGSVGFLTVFDHVGTEGAVAFAGEVPYALAAYDVLGDSYPDLAVTFESNPDMLVAENLSTGGAPTFAPSLVEHTFFLDMYEHLDLQPVVAGNLAPACFGDLDGDGRTDILLPADGAFGPVLLHGGFGPIEASPTERGILRTDIEACEDMASGYGRLTFDFDYPFADQATAGFTIDVFHQESPGAPLEALALSTCFVALAGPSYPDNQIFLDPLGEVWDDTNPNVYHLVLRPVDQNGDQVDAALAASFTLDPLGLVGSAPSDGWEQGPIEFEELIDCTLPITHEPGGTTSTGFVSVVRIPGPQGEIPVSADECLTPES